MEALIAIIMTPNLTQAQLDIVVEHVLEAIKSPVDVRVRLVDWVKGKPVYERIEE